MVPLFKITVQGHRPQDMKTSHLVVVSMQVLTIRRVMAGILKITSAMMANNTLVTVRRVAPTLTIATRPSTEAFIRVLTNQEPTVELVPGWMACHHTQHYLRGQVHSHQQAGADYGVHAPDLLGISCALARPSTRDPYSGYYFGST
jgi:hypothetical protein